MNRRNFIFSASALALVAACQSKSNESNELTIFSSITCIHCRTFYAEHEQYLVERNDVTVVPFHRSLVDVGAQMLIEKGGSPVRAYLYRNDDWLNDPLAGLTDVAKLFQLDIDLKAELNDPDRIDAMIEEMDAAVGFRHITGTPAFFFGNQKATREEASDFIKS